MQKTIALWLLSMLLATVALPTLAQKTASWQLQSPDGKITIHISAASSLTSWSVMHENTTVLAPSAIALTLATGEVLGNDLVGASAKTTSVQATINTALYKKATIADHYNQLVITGKKGYSVQFRAYNDGVAYRFVTSRKDSLVIAHEDATFAFDNDYNTFVPYAHDSRYNGDLFQTSFEALYEERKLSALPKDSIAFFPLLVALNDGKKVVITEADLENYPGTYAQATAGNSFKTVQAGYPTAEKPQRLNSVVTSRANYIARTAGTRSFPWRVLVISSSDAALADNDMVYKLAAPSRLTDVSWIQPGKVAWDWWNDWNISHVDFKAGINTTTYKYYIDFAAANHLEYIVMDEGWSVSTDITKISPRINLQEIIDYGKQKHVGVVLWATWFALKDRASEVFAQYQQMGVKGFKIDFMDRDDQQMVASLYHIAKVAADHKLMVDYHGMYKPTGLQRTYPNVIGFEGVWGLENMKWAPITAMPRYDVTIPYIRMLAGAVDYTPGAMRNATKSAYRPSNSLPMSQGTRSHELAKYIVFEAPLGMLADNPTVYMREQESTNFISNVPTVFNETRSLDGQVGEYISIARQNGLTWWVGAMTNWTARDITIDFSFLDDGVYEAEIFKDGVNADRDATDYIREVVTVTKADKRTVSLAPGGGWAARVYRKR